MSKKRNYKRTTDAAFFLGVGALMFSLLLFATLKNKGILTWGDIWDSANA